MMGYKTASSHFCMIFTWSLFFRLFHHRHPIFFVVLLFFMSRQPSLALTVEDILLGVDLNPKQKRHGTFFPSELDLASNFRHQALEEADDNSTWDFHAPVESLVKRPRFTANAVMSPAEKIVRYFRTSTSMSAAQRIVYQYRAGLKINLDDESAISSSRSLPSTRSPTLLGFATKSLDGHAEVEKAPVDDRWRSPIGEPQLRHSESRAGALAEAEKEALREIKFGFAYDAIVCPRKNCRETLSDVRALACHLSLHDIEKSKTYYCSDCDRGFDRRHALNAHTCLSRCRSAPSSPVFATFHHVLTRITSR